MADSSAMHVPQARTLCCTLILVGLPDGIWDHVACAAQLCQRLSLVTVASLVLVGLVVMVGYLMMAVCFAVYVCVAMKCSLSHPVAPVLIPLCCNLHSCLASAPIPSIRLFL